MSQIIRNRLMFVVSYYKNVFPEVQKFILLRYGDNSLSLMAKVIIYILYLHIDRYAKILLIPNHILDDH